MKRADIRFLTGLAFLAGLFFIGAYSAKCTAGDFNYYRLAANTTLAADWIQTREIARNPNYYETNPLLGKYPSQNDVNKYFIASIAITNVVGELLPPKLGNYFYFSVAAVETVQVTKNMRIGVQFKW